MSNKAQVDFFCFFVLDLWCNFDNFRSVWGQYWFISTLSEPEKYFRKVIKKCWYGWQCISIYSSISTSTTAVNIKFVYIVFILWTSCRYVIVISRYLIFLFFQCLHEAQQLIKFSMKQLSQPRCRYYTKQFG